MAGNRPVKPTVKDVAACAGYSTATISRVLNDDPKVSSATRIKVLRCMEKLGYTVNPIARSLKTSRTNTIGIISPEFQNDFFMAVAEGIEEYLKASGYVTFICNSRESVEEEAALAAMLVKHRVDGVIIIPASGEGVVLDHYYYLQEHHVPFVLVDRLVRGLSADAVLTDNFQGAFSAVDHCLRDGARKIGFIGGLASLTSASERLEGYRAAMEAGGCPIEEELMKFGDMHMQSGYALMEELLTESPDLQYVFIINLFMRIGAEKFLVEKGITRDIRIAAFDESSISSLFTHAWITVQQPLERIGARAAEIILTRIGNRELGFPQICREKPVLISHGKNE